MEFRLLPAEESDVPDMVTIFHTSFASDPIISRTMCNVPTNIRRAFDIEFFAKFFTTEKVYGAQVFKVLETETKWVFSISLYDYRAVENAVNTSTDSNPC